MTFRLLVADDSITIQKIVSMAFEIEDVEVEGIGNGQEAFDRISQFNPDVVLADVNMPGLNGFELSAKIKKFPETSAIKVLLLASDFDEFDEQRYQDCGADNHISKPFKSGDIVAMVKSLLETSSSDEGAVVPSGSYLVEEEGPIELTEKPLDMEDIELDSLSDQNALEPREEPSLEELLESVKKLSTEREGLPSSEGEIAEEELGLESPQEVGEVLGFTEEPEIFSEISLQKSDNLDELNSAFNEIVVGGGGSLTYHEEQAHPIAPEPEDFLECIAPDVFSEVGKRPATLEDVKESLLRSENWDHEGDNLFTQAITDEVKQLLQKSLGSSMEKEVFGLSDVILETVRKVVREVTPGIARRVIQEEIEKIKKRDMC